MVKKIPPRVKARSTSRNSRVTKKKVSNATSSIRHHRRLHVRLSLHPANLMVALCTGVLLVAATISSYGDSLTVNGEILAAPLTSPAIITAPAAGTVFTDSSTDVTGTCPDSSYVDVSDNGAYQGVSTCTNGAFDVPVTLVPDDNELTALDYNITNQAGPTSPAISVTYNAPVPPATPPSSIDDSGSGSNTIGDGDTTTATAAPISLVVVDDDSQVSYNRGAAPIVTPNPIFQGVAPPFSQVTLLFHSTPRTCITTADSTGYWICQLSSPLPPGMHTVVVTALTMSGKILTIPLFYIQVKDSNEPTAIVPTTAPSITSSTYKYQVYQPYQNVPATFKINGGVGPYTLTVNWGDGSVTTQVYHNSGSVTFLHQYNSLHRSSDTYTIKIESVDADGETATTQQIAVIKNSSYAAVSSGTTSSKTTAWGKLVSDLHPWLWVLWPGYAIILLMIVSFWLGERKQLENDRKYRASRAIAATRRKQKRRHA